MVGVPLLSFFGQIIREYGTAKNPGGGQTAVAGG